MFPQSLLSIFVIMNIRIPITIAKKVEIKSIKKKHYKYGRHLKKITYNNRHKIKKAYFRIKYLR